MLPLVAMLFLQERHDCYQKVHRLFQITYESGKLHFGRDHFIELGERALTTCSLAPTTKPQSQPFLVTVSVHYVCTPECGSAGFQDDIYVVIARGGPDELKIPLNFIYHDPQHIWKCQSWLINSPVLERLVEDSWPKDTADAAKGVAKHTIWHFRNSVGTANQIHLSNKDGDVRFRDMDKKSFKKSKVLEIWSHVCKPTSVINHLLDDAEFISWLQLLNPKEKPSPEVAQVIDRFFAKRIPVSSKHATTHFRLCKIARPNQMGTPTMNEESARTNHVIYTALSADRIHKSKSNQPKRVRLENPTRPHHSGDTPGTSEQCRAELSRSDAFTSATGSPKNISVLAQNGWRPHNRLPDYIAVRGSKMSHQKLSKKKGYSSSNTRLSSHRHTSPKQCRTDSQTRHSKQYINFGKNLPSKEALENEAKKLKSNLLYMDNDNESHIKFSRQATDSHVFTVDYVVRELLPDIRKKLAERTQLE